MKSVYSLCGLVLVVVHGSLEYCQLGWNVVSESVPQHVHQESHIPRPKLGLPLHHELPPGLEPFVHAGIVTLVQRGSCSCHHQNVVHLCAECAFFAPEICVESRCRRCFCLRQLFLIPLIHGSEVRSQFERPIIGSPSNWSDFPITRVSTTPACTRCLGVLEMLCTCCASLSLSCASIVIAVSCCCGHTFSCWMTTAIVSCSFGVDMVVYTRGASRRAYSFQVSALDPSCDCGSRPATTFSLDTLVTSVPGALLTAPPDSHGQQGSRFQSSVKQQSRLRYRDVQPSVLLHVPLRGPCWNDVRGWRDVPSTQRGGERHLQFYANFRRVRVIAKKYKLCGVSKIIISSESIMIEKRKNTKCVFLHHLRYMGAFSASQVEISTSHVRRWRNTCIQNNVNTQKKTSHNVHVRI